jgi:hypothetical protein
MAHGIRPTPGETGLVNRQPTPDERRIVDAILGIDFPGVEVLREQAREMRVVGGCGCGCPTVYFEPRVDAPTVAYEHDGPVPAEGDVATDPPGQILLFTSQGRLSSLEYVFVSDDPPREWPRPAQLTVAIPVSAVFVIALDSGDIEVFPELEQAAVSIEVPDIEISEVIDQTGLHYTATADGSRTRLTPAGTRDRGALEQRLLTYCSARDITVDDDGDRVVAVANALSRLQ